LPSQWIQLAKDFQVGINSKSIKNWTIAEFAEQDLEQLRNKVILRDKKVIDMGLIMKRLAYSGSIFSMIAGGVGMIYCLPYYFISDGRFSWSRIPICRRSSTLHGWVN